MDLVAPRPAASLREQLVAVMLAALCAALFLGEALIPGKCLVPYPPEAMEPMRSEALADGRVDLAEILRGNPSFGDKYNQTLNWDRTTQQALREGRLPLWTRGIGGGAPFVPHMGQIYQPWNALLLAVPSTAVYGVWYLLHQVLFGWFAYRFLRRIGTAHEAALLGTVAATVGLWTQARVHHNVILTAALPTFAMLSCVHRLFVDRGVGARAAGGLALGTGLSWLSGLPQVSLLASYLTVAWALLLALGVPRGTRLRPLLWSAAGLLCGGLVSLAQVGPVLFAAADSARQLGTTADLVARSLQPGHLFGLVWPDLLSWPSEMFYRDSIDVTAPSWNALLWLDPTSVLHLSADKYPECAMAVGSAPLILALTSLGAARRAVAWFFAAVAATGLLIACMAWPVPALTHVIPGLRTGDPRRAIFLCAVALPVLAALGLDRLLQRRSRLPVGAMLLATVLLLLSAQQLLVHRGSAEAITDRYAPLLAARYAEVGGVDAAAAEDAIRQSFKPGEAEANRDQLVRTFARASIAGGAVLLLLLLPAVRRRPHVLGLGLALVTAVELAHAGRGPVVAVDRARVETPPRVLGPALAATRATTGPRPRLQRLAAEDAPTPAPFLRPNLGAFFGLEDLSSYHPLPPRRLEELFLAIEPDAPGKPSVAFGGAGVDGFRAASTLDHPLLDVLGIRWLLTTRQLQRDDLLDRTPPDAAAPFRLYERTTTVPRATFVTRARIEPDRERRLALLADRARDARQELVLEDANAPRPGAPSAAAADVHLVLHADERVVVQVDTSAAGYLRLADPSDPGWRVTVDGAAAPLYIADHFLRAVWLEAGAHEVVFSFDGARVSWPPRLSLLGLLLAVTMIFWPRKPSP
ncbi:MAG: hypothetical protein AAF628_30480 [Planctomycetota bacterium]